VTTPPMFSFSESDEVTLQQLKDWWMGHCEDTFNQIAPKVVAYSSHDLEMMGVGLTALTAADIPDPLEARRFGVYAACAFYALGKIARITGALEKGHLPGPDSEMDLMVYSMMMARIREKGGWPA
jgi:hypothetical protein